MNLFSVLILGITTSLLANRSLAQPLDQGMHEYEIYLLERIQPEGCHSLSVNGLFVDGIRFEPGSTIVSANGSLLQSAENRPLDKNDARKMVATLQSGLKAVLTPDAFEKIYFNYESVEMTCRVDGDIDHWARTESIRGYKITIESPFILSLVRKDQFLIKKSIASRSGDPKPPIHHAPLRNACMEKMKSFMRKKGIPFAFGNPYQSYWTKDKLITECYFFYYLTVK